MAVTEEAVLDATPEQPCMPFQPPFHPGTQSCEEGGGDFILKLVKVIPYQP